MKTLIIYDNEGYILQQITGSYRVPNGIPYLEIDQESYKGKIIKSVNIETKELITESEKPSEVETLKQKLEETQKLLSEFVDMKYNMLLNN